MSEQERIDAALEFARQYGGIEGGHHKSWVIDQMVRALTGCPVEEKTGIGSVSGKPFTYEVQGDSEEYRAFIARARAGEDGPDTYDWDEGVAP